MGNRWPLRLAPVGPLSMGASLWRLEGQLMATIVAKVTASFAIDGVMSVVEPEPVRVEDEHDGGHPMRSLVGARELAPQLYKVDVLMVGHAYPQQGAAQTRARLAMEHGGAWVINKMVTVYGDRKDGGPPESFDKVRLGWEKAFGGIGHPENPLGTGFGSTTTQAPNVIYSDGRDAPASFGPIPQSFPSRKRLLGGISRKQVTEGIAEVPSTFNWAYFQCAPADQQLEALHGDEWLHLEGIHPGMRRIRTRLPGVQVATKVYGHAAAGVPNMIPMRADMVLIEPDELRAALVYRGSFPVMRPDALGSIIIAAGIERADEPMLWPESTDDLDALAYEPAAVEGNVVNIQAPPSNAAPRPFEGTFALDPDQLKGSASKPLPFAVGAASSGGTRTGPPSTVAPSGGLPFGGAAGGDEKVPDSHPLAGTVSISDEHPVPASMPFPAAERKPPSAPREIPGAPWASTPAAPVVPPQPDAVVTATGSPPKARTMLAHEMDAALSDLGKTAPPTIPGAETKAAQKQVDVEQARQKRARVDDAVAKERAAKDKAAEDEAERERLAAEREAEVKAAAEAEARRKQEAETFRKEQEEAEREAKRRAEEEAAKKREAAKKLRDNIYGGFKRRG